MSRRVGMDAHVVAHVPNSVRPDCHALARGALNSRSRSDQIAALKLIALADLKLIEDVSASLVSRAPWQTK